MSTSSSFPQRQIHLDFHTSPFIPDVASEFDAQEFAQTFVRAHCDSVTVFAKCHHGMCYYPTQTGTQHPALKGRDLLGEQIEALHRAGLRAPIYTTVVWEEDVAQRFPQWRQLRRDGTFAGTALATDNSGPHPGAWKWNNFLHPAYQDYIEAHIREVCERYGNEVDGFFFDILMMHRTADWSEAGLAFRRKHGFMGDDSETQDRFESAAQADFARKFSQIVRGLNPNARLFYNSSIHTFCDAGAGVRERFDEYTHFEVESLPSGFWGYQHFPRMARQTMTWGKPWLGMTGRFQRQWGDFGGIKPQPALEFECFRSQALGGANSVGDQLPPRGVLDRAAYDLIGAVYQQCEAAEPFYEGSHAIPQIGIVSPNFPGLPERETHKTEEGVVQMCEETHYDCAVLDDANDLDAFDLVILPDSTVITPSLRSKLARFHQDGGKLLISHKGGFDAQGEWALPFLPLSFEGETDNFPNYWRAKTEFDAVLARSDRVFYGRGQNVRLGQGVRVLVERVPSYFQRTDVHFSSHFQTPPRKEAGAHPAVVAGENFVYFADPIFREYRQTGNVACRDAWKRAVQNLIGQAPFGAELPTTVLSVPRRRDDDLILTLLHYIPLRKALDIDVIEERMGFAGEKLQIPGAPAARVWNGQELPRDEAGAFVLPAVKGRLLIEVPRFFAR